MELQTSTSKATSKGETTYSINQSRRQSEPSHEANADSRGQLWEIKCRDIGVSLARNAAPRLPGESGGTVFKV